MTKIDLLCLILESLEDINQAIKKIIEGGE